MMCEEAKNEVVVKAHSQLIEDFTHEYITNHTVCSPDDFKRRVCMKCVKLAGTLIVYAILIGIVVWLWKINPLLLMPVLVIYMFLGFTIYDGMPIDYYDESFVELKNGLERFFWLSDKLEQMCYMSYEDLLNDRFINNILGTSYIDDKKKQAKENLLYEVVHTKGVADIGLLTETLSDGTPKTILARSSKYNIDSQYGGTELLHWTHTGIFMTREEWNRISYETPTHILRERLGLGKSETESISRSDETKSMFCFEDWERVNEKWGMF